MLDDKWYFHRGDIQIEKPYWKGPVYTQGKTKRKLNGPAAYAYEDAPDQYACTKSALLNHEWREVTIPRTEHWICFYKKRCVLSESVTLDERADGTYRSTLEF